MKKGLIDKFRVRLPYATNNRFVDITVWENKTALQKATKEKRGVEGLFHPEPYTAHPRRYIPKKIGDIHFHKGRIGVGVISHEVAHSAVHIFDVLKYDIVDKDNELFAHYIGYVVKEICNRFIEKKYY